MQPVVAFYKAVGSGARAGGQWRRRTADAPRRGEKIHDVLRSRRECLMPHPQPSTAKQCIFKEKKAVRDIVLRPTQGTGYNHTFETKQHGTVRVPPTLLPLQAVRLCDAHRNDLSLPLPPFFSCSIPQSLTSCICSAQNLVSCSCMFCTASGSGRGNTSVWGVPCFQTSAAGMLAVGERINSPILLYICSQKYL